jgi:copper resistance protein D
MRTLMYGAAVAAILTVGSLVMGQGMGPGMKGGMMAPPASIGRNPLPSSKAVLAKGKELYEANCSACHGVGGRGDGPAAAALKPPPPDLRAAAKWSDGQIAAQIQNGRGVMPPFKASLDADSIWSIVNYVRRLQH